jgi:hypothetical protein
VGSCEHSYELLNYMKYSKFIEQLSDCQFIQGHFTSIKHLVLYIIGTNCCWNIWLIVKRYYTDCIRREATQGEINFGSAFSVQTTNVKFSPNLFSLGLNHVALGGFSGWEV